MHPTDPFNPEQISGDWLRYLAALARQRVKDGEALSPLAGVQLLHLERCWQQTTTGNQGEGHE